MSSVIKEQFNLTMSYLKENVSLFGYIVSKYLLEIVACLVVILSYSAMFVSYFLMNVSNKIYVFINLTYSDFTEYSLELFVEKAIKKFYTKFPTMKKYFVTPEIKKEKIVSSSNEVVDLTQDEDEGKKEN